MENNFADRLCSVLQLRCEHMGIEHAHTNMYNIIIYSKFMTCLSEAPLDWLEAPEYPSWWQITLASVRPK